MIGNLFWGMQFAPFSHKTALDRQSVLSRLFRVKTAQSHTAITSIVICFANQLQIKHKSIIFRHCEANHRFAKAIQNFCDSKNDKNKSARSATLKASSGAGTGVVREGEGSDFAIQAPTPSLKENARRQKWDSNADLSAESHYKIISKINFSKVPIQ